MLTRTLDRIAMSTQPSLALPTQTDDFIAEIERFSAFGERTICETANGIDYFVNEFWTARQRQAHRLHEISYRACFKPQLPAFFIDRLTEPGDTVYDPFMGRGTTPLGSGLIDQSQKMTVAARATAEKKAFGHRS